MEWIHMHGIRVAEVLQFNLMDYRGFWLFVTHMGHPKAAFLLYFPVTFFLNRKAGIAVLWVAILAEWSNLILKWFLFGERPYWWVSESGLFGSEKPKLIQFSSSCETGPGSPSGHSMVTAAVWLVMMTSLSSHLQSRSRSPVLKVLPVLLYLLVLLVVGISRVFTLSHFPHQVVTGCITGAVLGYIVIQHVPEGKPLRFFALSTLGLLLGALLLYWCLELGGVNLSWSIELAQKWCVQPEWIRLDTAPFSSLTRDTGALLGLGLALYLKPGGWELPLAPRALSLAFSSMALYHLNRLALPTYPPLLFYCLFFIKNGLVPLFVMAVVPRLVHAIAGQGQRQEEKDK
ncbi:glucose-6-phosphatase 3 isoform X2 [Polyodon spathula]|uniref:glucose-6-phosphatase 3 isoform X2 n=1 Tax=Polyodon spathula TaxID=7913 RepID=UPI001B7F6879|nr:glucose-6-phosphatase 3 isoform X2 [Polyodon spathula]